MDRATTVEFSEGSDAGMVQYMQHGAEIDRQTAVIDQLDHDAKQESHINQVWEGEAELVSSTALMFGKER